MPAILETAGMQVDGQTSIQYVIRMLADSRSQNIRLNQHTDIMRPVWHDKINRRARFVSAWVVARAPEH